MTPVNRKAGTGERTRELPGKRPGILYPAGFATTDLGASDFVMLVGREFAENGRHAAFLFTSRDRSVFSRALYACSCRFRRSRTAGAYDRVSEEAETEHPHIEHLDALRPLMTKQQKTALNMAKFIQNQSLLLLEKLNCRSEADLCEKLHDDAEHLFRTVPRLDELQDGN